MMLVHLMVITVLIAASYGWIVKSFEMNPRNYSILCRNIHDNKFENQIIPIYTKIDLHPSLDHFILNQNIGLICINVENNIGIINRIKTFLEHQLIDSLIINIYPRLQPINVWIETITYIEKLGYNIFDLKTPHIDKNDEFVKMFPLVLENIHRTSETTLLFLKNSYLNQSI